MFENKHDIYAFLADNRPQSLCRHARRAQPRRPWHSTPRLCRSRGAVSAACRICRPISLWPVRNGYEGGHVIADKLNRGGDIAEALTMPLPLEFVAELDLAGDRAARSARGTFCPFEGRLLFFRDGICGPWIDTAASCRVIWDRSSRQAGCAEILDALQHDDDPHQARGASGLRSRAGAWSRSGPCPTAASSRI